MTKFLKHVIAVAAATLAFGANAQLVIDDFNINQVAIDDTSSNGVGLWSQMNGPAANILGGQRDLYVTKVGNAADDANGDRVRASVAGGLYRFSTDSGQNGFGIIRWDGVNALPADATNAGAGAVTNLNATGLGGVDLASQGAGFKITVPTADLGFPFSIQVYTDASNYTTLSLFSPGPGVYNITFADILNFGVSVGTGADFSNVGAIQAIVNVGGLVTDVDFQIDIAQLNLPEPTTLALVGLTLLGVGVARRRSTAAK